MIRFKLDDLIRFDGSAPHLQSVAESGNTRVTLICLKEGQSLKDHRTECQVTIHMLRGRAVIIEEGKSLQAREGELVLIPSGARHRVEAEGDCALLAILAPHPARKQYPEDQVDRWIPHASHEVV